ncbi:MAG: LPS export ABC transporter ATP-binding protein [Proteobacteria bacterium]|nr:LPS export ABC transporter ATP-binding protein [Pseudomonadota bacterium]
MKNALIVSNLEKRYKKRIVVRDFSLQVNAGEVVGLLGPNGAGKTTCFYIIVGLVPCDKGSVILNDQDLTHAPMHIRARKGIGYLPQEASVFRKLSVKDNILAILETRADLSKSARINKTDELLDEFNLTHVQNALGISLSGGERRRVEIARALACDPKFILLDEPFAGVDPISVNDIKYQISLLTQKKIGVLITDHNVRETLDICHRATIVNDGKVIACGPPADILANQKVRDVYLGESFVL